MMVSVCYHGGSEQQPPSTYCESEVKNSESGSREVVVRFEKLAYVFRSPFSCTKVKR